MRRRGKELRERAVAALLLVPALPVIGLCAVAIKLEGLLSPRARGPVFFKETRISGGKTFELLKFRVLDRDALRSLGPGPTHIAELERGEHITRAGRVIKQWYLDELPQLLNIVKGDMGLIGTRPWPVELYEEEMARGITRKRDLPGGLVGPVQSRKGTRTDGLELDLEYLEAYRSYPGLKLLILDLKILTRSLRVLLEHKGI